MLDFEFFFSAAKAIEVCLLESGMFEARCFSPIRGLSFFFFFLSDRSKVSGEGSFLIKKIIVR